VYREVREEGATEMKIAVRQKVVRWMPWGGGGGKIYITRHRCALI